MQLLGKMLGDPNKKEIRTIQPLIDQINALEPEMQKLSDEQLAAKTDEFRSQLALYLKGGLVLEDELVSIFREVLDKVEPLAAKFTDEQLREAMREPRLALERRKNVEQFMRDNLQDALSEVLESAYERLNTTLNSQRVTRAMDIAEETQDWPDEAKDPQKATLALLKQAEPAIAEIDDEFQEEAFQKAWPKFEEARNNAPDKEEGADERLEALLGSVLHFLRGELIAIKAEAMDELLPAIAKRYRTGKTLDDILPEAFAVVREAGRRTIKMRHYDVQLIGGVVLHQGKIAEMKTGEGKTLVATLAAYLNALPGKGVHVVTVNDYLAQRDSNWMGKIYNFLNLSVGVIINAVDPQSPARRAAYNADITYGTNNEFGFDYLRDNMVTSIDQVSQRQLNYAIVDEVDNILIDEARTPLIISGQDQESTDQYARFAKWAPRLKAETDYTIEEKTRTVMLTDSGVEKIEQLAGIKNIYDPENVEMTRYMENAIKAQVIFKRDRDYIVKDGEVIIVDEFTGRQMIGRRYSDGLHQAIEAKEGVKVQHENRTLATITFQNYFRLYKKLAGMTGTALTEAEELFKIYKLEVIVIPTHKPMIRIDQPDLIYRTEDGKFRAVVEEIRELHEKGQPVLVGTTSVEISEHLSEMLDREGIPHNVLNAKHHAREAQIVAQAGRSGAVTIATNMAGRGTDIELGGNPAGYFDAILRKHAEQVDFIRDMPVQDDDDRLDKEEAIREYIANMTEEEKEELFQSKIRECQEDHNRVVELGGLRIIGTERHESRRIDNQLRGRAGRQGDPGSSRFYLSLEDDLMKRFAADRVSKFMEFAGMDEDMPLESGLVSRFIEQAQTRVEGYNFDTRKHVVEYDDVIAKQREVIYADRRAVLEHADLHERVLSMIRTEVQRIVEMQIPGTIVNEEEELEHLFNTLETWVHIPDDVLPDNIHAVRKNDLLHKLTDLVIEHYEERGNQLDAMVEQNPGLGIPSIRDLERSFTLQVIDRLWMDHIHAVDMLRNSIGFRSIAQRDPLVEFKNEAFRMFEELKAAIQHHIVDSLLKLLRDNITIRIEQPAPKRKAAPRNLRTNADDIARAVGQAKSDSSTDGTSAGRRAATSTATRTSANGHAPVAPQAARQVPAKIGRNDPCPCGSGKKYKKCHGA